MKWDVIRSMMMENLRGKMPAVPFVRWRNFLASLSPADAEYGSVDAEGEKSVTKTPTGFAVAAAAADVVG